MSISRSNGLRDVELRHLVALQAVAAERSFGRAAVRLGYTQSAISQQIAALERIVGEPVFDRPGGPRPVALTTLGTLLLDHAQAILDRVSVADADLAGYRAGRLGRLSVGTFQSVSVKVLPEVVRRLRHDRPELDIRLFESDDQRELRAGLEDGSLDLSFLVGPLEDAEGLEVETLGTDPFVLVSRQEDRLCPDGEAVATSRLDGLDLVGQTLNPCQALIEDGFRHLGVEPHIVFRTGDNSAVQAMVRSGTGHAVMPLLALRADDPGIAIRLLEPPIPARTICLGVPATRHRAPAVEAFADLARAVCAAIVPSSAGATVSP